MRRRSNSEMLAIGLLLSLTGGFLEAYTYMLRGSVFCNAQTSNLALMTLHLVQGNIRQGLYYPIPIVEFFLGTLLALQLRDRLINSRIHWESVLILIEAAILFLIGFVPLSAPNAIANVTISFICAMQYETFRVAGGLPYASTFITGNLRMTAEHFYQWTIRREHQARRMFFNYVGVIGIFAVGVALGAVTSSWGAKSIWVSSAVLLVVFGLMEFWKQKD